MAVQQSRRAFFNRFTAHDACAVRPPWALAERAFTDSCTRCGDCVRACPEHILSSGSGGFPDVDFSAGGCTFCAACADACRAGALDRRRSQAPWALRVTVALTCLGARGVECRTCGDWCDARAIRFPVAGHPAPPSIDSERCTRCGACVAPCPVSAITVQPEESTTDV